jgi:hypothetical protein
MGTVWSASDSLLSPCCPCACCASKTTWSLAGHPGGIGPTMRSMPMRMDLGQ